MNELHNVFSKIRSCYVKIGWDAIWKRLTNFSKSNALKGKLNVSRGSVANRELSGQSFVYLQRERAAISTPCHHESLEKLLKYCDDFLRNGQPFDQLVQPMAGFFLLCHLEINNPLFWHGYELYKPNSSS